MAEPPRPEAHDARWLARVRPPDWRNPAAAERYDLLVIGGGTAGLVSAAIAAGLGARVALVERDRLGGDCLNVGCVPSKALLRMGRAAAAARDGERFGVRVEGVEVDFAGAMERMRRLRADLAEADSAERFRGLGVDVFLGEARFSAPDRVDVEGVALSFRRAVLATGTRPAVPPIPGLDPARILTNETVFDLTERPRRLAVLGGGPIGCELAQAFARLGSAVILIERADRLLPAEDADAAAVVAGALARDGIDVRTAAEVVRAEPGDGSQRLVLHGAAVEADRLLVAVGRVPNVEGLGLEAAGIELDAAGGVGADRHLRTTNRRVWAAGDVLPGPRFTHLSDAQARIAVRNALFPGREDASTLVVPRCTYTDPELAAVGHTGRSAREAGIEVDTRTIGLSEIDRAVLDGVEEGFVRVHLRKGSDEIVGGTLVAPHAGETIGELTLAIQRGIGLSALSDVIHPYPTVAEALRKLGDRHRRGRLTPRARWLIGKWLAWRR